MAPGDTDLGHLARSGHHRAGPRAREITTDPAVKGDTSGKVLKPAKLVGTGFEISVPLFVEDGDKIEIDTRTHEYRKRV